MAGNYSQGELIDQFRQGWAGSQTAFCTLYNVNNGNFSGYLNQKNSQPAPRAALLRWLGDNPRLLQGPPVVPPPAITLPQRIPPVFTLPQVPAIPLPQAMFTLPPQVLPPAGPVPNRQVENYVFRSLSGAEILFRLRNPVAVKGDLCARRTGQDISPQYHVSHSPAYSPFISASHSPMAVLFYNARQLVESPEHKSVVAHINRGDPYNERTLAVDNRTADLGRWSVTARNFLKHSDELLFRDSVFAHSFSHFTDTNPLYLPWLTQLKDEESSYTRFLRTSKLSMPKLLNGLSSDLRDTNGNTYRITRARKAFLERFFGKEVYMTPKGTFHHTNDDCHLLRQAKEAEAWSCVPETEAVRVGWSKCSHCKKKDAV